MADYLLDTNTLVLAASPGTPQSEAAVNAVDRLRRTGNTVWLCPQVLSEFWVVATRPQSANGLGWTAAEAESRINLLLRAHPLLEEYPDLFHRWLKLVSENQVIGKRAHDYRLFAMAELYDVPRLLTFDAASVPAGLRVRAVNPAEVSG